MFVCLGFKYTTSVLEIVFLLFETLPSEIISDFGKSDETDQYPRNQKIQKLVNEIINDDVTSTSAAEVSSSPLDRSITKMPYRHQPRK